MTHRKLYWILTLLIFISIILLFVGCIKLNTELISLGTVSLIVLFIVRKIVKVDNGLKGKQDK